MVCKHCAYFIERDSLGQWSAPSPMQHRLCHKRHAIDGRWDHEPSSPTLPVSLLLLLLLALIILLLAGIRAFGGLVKLSTTPLSTATL